MTEERRCYGCDTPWEDQDLTSLPAPYSDEEYCPECLHEQLDDIRIGQCEDAMGEDYLIDGVGFADSGGESALRAATPDNPRNLPCPSCDTPNRLTPADRRAGYQCDTCADLLFGY